ncbi:DUF2125 domain-containing protein [Pseudooceanicola nanhaiensis]|uniref:DUF2125 domain-containing protein n=1 Tax=Pseudooceanicola nanhaiensis TaxID=375761 RepID=A0A917SRR4_9RHOB|nr:DUF2125 domain-containing protein [Pseudooceanicola nanhaiensis]GGL95220.1 hypothetical protein GCM10011534_16740 [Pseudooceanicola nanhaiensis]
MKRLLIVILVAAAAWSGYWFIGSYGLKSAYEGWFEARREDGWQADYADLSVRGFPNRFDTTFTDLAIADPATGWAWEAPFFQLLALSYRPNSVIAVFPPESTIATPNERLALTTSDTKASLTLGASSRLPLQRATLVGSDLMVEGVETVSLDSLRLAAELLPGSETDYHLGFRAEGLALPDPLLGRLSGGVALPDLVDKVHVDADVKFDAPWDLDAIEQRRPQPRHLRLRLAEAEWGALKLSATGELDIDAAGTPTGEIAVKAENWRDMLDLAVAAGALPESVAASAEKALGLVAGLSGRADTLNATIAFRDGGMYLGPVPLGEAPVMALR